MGKNEINDAYVLYFSFLSFYSLIDSFLDFQSRVPFLLRIYIYSDDLQSTS
jgi:hypothetical protein